MLQKLFTSMLLPALALGVAACGKKEDVTSTMAINSETIKIGSVSPLTGPQAHLGKDNDNGARMAIDEINAEGLTIGGKKIHLELLSEDDQTDPKTARHRRAKRS